MSKFCLDITERLDYISPMRISHLNEKHRTQLLSIIKYKIIYLLYLLRKYYINIVNFFLVYYNKIRNLFKCNTYINVYNYSYVLKKAVKIQVVEVGPSSFQYTRADSM